MEKLGLHNGDMLLSKKAWNLAPQRNLRYTRDVRDLQGLPARYEGRDMHGGCAKTCDTECAGRSPVTRLIGIRLEISLTYGVG